MASSKPAVAILVPVYNGGRFLGETLASIEAQTYRNLRVLIRDDGSTDDSMEIISRFVGLDPRFHLIPGGDRLGAENNCRQLTLQSNEPFVKLLMQDDPLHPQHVEKLVTPMIKNPDITMAAAARERVDAEGVVLPQLAYNTPLVEGRAVLEGESAARNVLLTHLNRIGEPSTAIVRNGRFDAEHPFAFAGRDYFAMSDVAMWLTLLSQGSMFYTSETLSSFRHHGAQRSQDQHVHIQCVLEWAYLLEGAVRTGLLAADDKAHACAVELTDWNMQMIGSITRSNSRQFERHLPNVLNAIEDLWTTMSASLAVSAAGDHVEDQAGENAIKPPNAEEESSVTPRTDLGIVGGNAGTGALSVRLERGWDCHPAWLSRLAELADRFPGLAVSLPLSSDDDGSGAQSTVHLARAFINAGADLDHSGDFSLDPVEPDREPPLIVHPLQFTPASLDLVEAYLDTAASSARAIA